MVREPVGGSPGTAVWAASIAAMVLRLLALAIAARTEGTWIDPDSYLVHADALRGAGSWVAALTDTEGLIRPPLYPVWLALMRAAGLAPGSILVVQALLAAIATAAVYAIARTVAGHRGSLAAAWGFALWPPSISASAAFWSESLFVPLALAGLACLLTSLRGERVASLVWAGVLFAVAALTRSLLLVVGPVSIAVAGWRYDSRRRVLVAMAVFVVLIGAYSFALSREAGRPLILDNTADWHWRARSSTPGEASAAPIGSAANAMGHAFAREPIRSARESLARVRAVLWPDAGTGLLIASTGLVALVGGVRARRAPAAAVLVAWIALQLVCVALIPANAGPRYRAAIDPVLLALAAAAMPRV